MNINIICFLFLPYYGLTNYAEDSDNTKYFCSLKT